MHVLAENSDSLHEETLKAYIPWTNAETIYGAKIDSNSDVGECGICMSRSLTVVGEEGEGAVRFQG